VTGKTLYSILHRIMDLTGNLEKEENDEILEMYDYLAEKIARYYIDNHYLNE
jgi:hypothetical protein